MNLSRFVSVHREQLPVVLDSVLRVVDISILLYGIVTAIL